MQSEVIDTEVLDTEAMNDATEATASAGRARLERRKENALIGGVASGIAERYGIKPVLVRMAAILLGVIGGVGVRSRRVETDQTQR